MSMIDLTITKQDREGDEAKFEKDMASEENYPWGLGLHFEDREMEKLSLDPSKLSVGDEIPAMVKLKVTSLNQSEGMGGRNVSASMQVIAMDTKFEKEKDNVERQAQSLYGD